MATSEQSMPLVPRKFAGLWIAWDGAKTKIVASGRTLGEARHAAESAGEGKPIFAKAPRADIRFLGGVR